jgi:phosphatidylglycerophosphatase C
MAMPDPISRVTIFDLDGTLTRHDTFAGFLIGYLRLNPRRFMRSWRVAAVLLRYLVGGFDRGLLKQSIIQIFMRGDARAKVDSWARDFATRIVASGCHPAALRTLEEHRKTGDFLVLLSASPSLYVPRIGHLLRVDRVICTDVAFDGEILRGDLITPNRRGEEKARCLALLRSEFPRAVFTAYGNSASDLPHLRGADFGMLVNGGASARHRAKRLNIGTAHWA